VSFIAAALAVEASPSGRQNRPAARPDCGPCA
jgi:hypothetical protein